MKLVNLVNRVEAMMEQVAAAEVVVLENGYAQQETLFKLVDGKVQHKDLQAVEMWNK